jgi:hypothetical protein
MAVAESDAMVTMSSPVQQAGDESMVGRERWEEITDGDTRTMAADAIRCRDLA